MAGIRVALHVRIRDAWIGLLAPSDDDSPSVIIHQVLDDDDLGMLWEKRWSYQVMSWRI